MLLKADVADEKKLLLAAPGGVAPSGACGSLMFASVLSLAGVVAGIMRPKIDWKPVLAGVVGGGREESAAVSGASPRPLGGGVRVREVLRRGRSATSRL